MVDLSELYNRLEEWEKIIDKYQKIIYLQTLELKKLKSENINQITLFNELEQKIIVEYDKNSKIELISKVNFFLDSWKTELNKCILKHKKIQKVINNYIEEI